MPDISWGRSHWGLEKKPGKIHFSYYLIKKYSVLQIWKGKIGEIRVVNSLFYQRKHLEKNYFSTPLLRSLNTTCSCCFFPTDLRPLVWHWQGRGPLSRQHLIGGLWHHQGGSAHLGGTKARPDRGRCHQSNVRKEVIFQERKKENKRKHHCFPQEIVSERKCGFPYKICTLRR